jgi:hypothetical protein
MYMYAGESRDYGRVVVAGFTILTGLMVFLSESLYRTVLEDYMKLALVEEYSYLIVVLFSVMILFYYLLRDLGLSYEVRVGKTLASALLASLSLVFYVSRLFDLEYSIQYGSISLVLITLSLITVVYNPSTLKDLIPLLSLFFLVPLPTSFVDSITPYLSRFVGRLAALLTGATLVEGPAYTRLMIETPSGPTLFDVGVVCSGITVISSVLAAVPVIVYLAVSSPYSVRRKLTGALVSFSLATLIGFLGGLVRVVLVVFASTTYGVEVGMGFTRYLPSAIYSAISVLTALLIANKYVGLRYVTPRPLLKRVNVEWGYVAGVLMVVLAFLSAYTITLSQIVASHENASLSNDIIVDLAELSDFTNHPPRYVFNASKNLKLVRYSYNSYLTRVLGASSVYDVLVVGNVSYTGYVEVVETPGRLHTWQLCLALQEYKVLNSWSKLVNGTRLYFIEVGKEGFRGVLGYVLIPVIAKAPEEKVVAYVRVSLMRLSSGASVDSAIKEVEGGLLEISAGGGSAQALEDVLYWSILTSQALALFLATYLVVIWFPNLIIFIRKFIKSIRL